MHSLSKLIWSALVGLFRSRASLQAENLVLRHQLKVLCRKSRRRITSSAIDRLLFVGLYALVPSVLYARRSSNPTVIRWHRAGFRTYWRWKSRSRGGRPGTRAEIRQLIHQMSIANPFWGAPRIYGELLKLGSMSARPRWQCTWRKRDSFVPVVVWISDPAFGCTAEAIDLTCSGVMHTYGVRHIEGTVGPGATIVDLEQQRITTPVGKFRITSISDASISFDQSYGEHWNTYSGFQEELAVFGTLGRVSGHMTVFWRNPKDNAKMAMYSELECSAAKRLF